jgi:hypothetical protein
MAEEGSGARVAVVSYGIWQRRFASSPDIVGKTLEIDQAAYEVIGVMPSTFAFPEKDAEVWLPIATDPGRPVCHNGCGSLSFSFLVSPKYLSRHFRARS